jgi:hypothetical protein
MSLCNCIGRWNNTNLVFKCRINKLSLSKVCKDEKSLHRLPRVAIALAEAQAMVLFFNEYKSSEKRFICGN